MIYPEKKPVYTYPQPDASAAGDWLRLGVMLLLLVVGRSVAPISQAPNHLASAAPDVPKTPIASYFLARASR